MTPSTDPFDRLHDALVASASTLPETATGNRGPTRHRRRFRVLGPLAVAGLAIGGTALAATTPWNPQIGPDPTDSPPVSHSAAPAEQIAALGVLRRPQTDRDRSTPTEDALRTLEAPGRGLRVDSIRLLRTHDGAATILMSLARLGDRRHPPVTRDALCVSETTSATQRDTARRQGQDHSNGLGPVPVALGGSSCGSYEDLLRGRLRTVTTGLVPDGVARVQVKLTTGRTVSARVRDNFYALPIDVSAGGASPRSPADRAALRRFRTINGQRIEWLNSGGDVVRKNDIARKLHRDRTD